jgi:hypothetical protein
MFVAIALTVVGLVWFVLAQRRPERPFTVLPASAAGSVEDVKPDEAAAVTADPEDAAADAGGPDGGDNADQGEPGDPSAPGQAAGADDATVATVRSDE